MFVVVQKVHAGNRVLHRGDAERPLNHSLEAKIEDERLLTEGRYRDVIRREKLRFSRLRVIPTSAGTASPVS